MKLNGRRVICVGFAFFLICTFWQAYDTLIPKILTDRFGMSQTASGVIMALDNILALFMLPLFGALSDRTKSQLGRRTPYILIGTIVAVIAFSALSLVDRAQLKRLDAVSDVNDPAVLEALYNYDYAKGLRTPEGADYAVSDFSREEFLSFTYNKDSASYTNYVVPARQAYIYEEITSSYPSVIIIFIAMLVLLLVSMATFRSPAVALMPDVVIKPLRSKANAIINLMGTVGGSIVLALGIVFGTGKTVNTFKSYTGYFLIIAGIMIVCLVAFMATVREVRFAAEMEALSKRYGISNTANESSGGKSLSKPELRSLLFILASIVFWFMGYNAVTSKYSVYAGNILNLDYSSTLLLANVAALISYIPVGIVASKIGRKKTITAGIVMLGAAFSVAAFLRDGTPLPVMMIIFALAGIGWATINVNSFPMVVELAHGGSVGKYTGFYYTASMAAQTATPIFSGFLMDKLGMTSLFPYAALFVAAAFITMQFVKHGDSKPNREPALNALGGDD